MKRNIFTVCMVLLLIGWMALIFGFSSQSGKESGGLSAIIAQPLTKLIVKLRGGMTEDAEAALYLRVDGGVRIAAHFTEYAILGMLLSLVLRRFRLKQLWLPWLIGTIYAVTDEWHQSFSPQRMSDPMDVLIDSFGVVCGVLLLSFLIRVWRKNHVYHQ